MFESCLSDKLLLERYFGDLRFGFTSGKGCQKALLSVESIINYYTCGSSSVYMAAQDASETFDRVSHYSLFLALMKYNVLLPFLKVIAY